MTDPVFTELLFWDLGGGAIAGLAVGYAVRRTTRLALLILGVGLICLFGLMKLGVVTVHWEILAQGIESGARGAADWLWLATKELSLALVGFGGGLAAGLKMTA